MPKRSALLLLCLSFIRLSQGDAQWVRLESPTSESFLDVQFPDENTGYLLSYHQLWKTDDGGNTFIDVTPGKDQTFMRILFLDDQIGFVLTNNSILYRTVDGGQTYEKTHFKRTPIGDVIAPVRDILFTDSVFGFCTSDHVFYYTETGGREWSNIGLDDHYTIAVTRDFMVQNTHAAYCVKKVADFYGYYMSYVFQYWPYWNGWTTIADDLDYISICAVANVSDSVFIYARDDNKDMYTYDYHSNKNVIHLHSFMPYTYRITDIRMLDNGNGFMCGRTNDILLPEEAIILQTADSGKTWQTVLTEPFAFSFNKMCFPSDRIGYAVGDYSVLWKWSSGIPAGSASDVLVYPNPSSGWVSVQIPDPDTVVHHEIIDALGRRLTVPYTYSSSTLLLDMHHQTAGVYFIRLYAGNETISIAKCVIQ
ncbi:MAG: YCF48-related protein [Chitinophagales bacterium]